MVKNNKRVRPVREVLRPILNWVPEVTLDHLSTKNFKGLEYGGVNLEKTSLLCGPNSSGKTSLIQSILLLAQQKNTHGQHAIEINGELTQLGKPTDVQRNGNSQIGFSIRGTYHPSDFVKKIVVEGKGERREGKAGTEDRWFAVDYILQSTAQEFGTGLEVREVKISSENLELKATRKKLRSDTSKKLQAENIETANLLSIESLEADGHSYDLPGWLELDGLNIETIILKKAKISKSNINERLRQADQATVDLLETLLVFGRRPERLAEQSGNRGTRDKITSSCNDYWRNRSFIECRVALFSINGEYLWPGLLIGLEMGTVLFDSIKAVNKALATFTSSVKYLGPLRQEPVVVSSTFGSQRSYSAPVGMQGERAPRIYAENRSRIISTRIPERSVAPNGAPEVSFKEVETSLELACAAWLQYLGIGEAIEMEDLGKLGQGITIKLGDSYRDLTSIGVGASQLLPVLILGLLTKSGEYAIFEQPELHLHPAVQSRLLDFFLHACKARCLIETHSEYLVTRLRLRSVSGVAEAQAVDVLYTRTVSGGFKIAEIQRDDLYDFAEWPDGFFDTLEDEVLSIHLQKAVRNGPGRQVD